MNKVQRMVLMALIVAIGTFTAQYTWFSVGVAKAAPVQHAINVISAVLFGPWGALEVAFVIGLLRNLLGVGSLLAFPGGMVGAFLAGYLYRLTGKLYFAPIGEVIGTELWRSLYVCCSLFPLQWNRGNNRLYGDIGLGKPYLGIGSG